VKRRSQGLSDTGLLPAADEVPDGIFLVRGERTQYRWNARKGYYLLRFAVIEPNRFASRSIAGRILLVALGARTILSDFPELCGVEQELIDRAVRREVGDRSIQLMREYAARAKAVRASF
jgi:hypothetical protein